MKIPQNTPKAVSAVRSLCRPQRAQDLAPFFDVDHSDFIASVGVMRAARKRRHEPGEHADSDQQQQGRDGELGSRRRGS
jgi:hypothetical protein